MKPEESQVREIATFHAKETVKALSVAQRMGLMNTEEDLTDLITAGIETALEEFISKNESLTP